MTTTPLCHFLSLYNLPHTRHRSLQFLFAATVSQCKHHGGVHRKGGGALNQRSVPLFPADQRVGPAPGGGPVVVPTVPISGEHDLTSVILTVLVEHCGCYLAPFNGGHVCCSGRCCCRTTISHGVCVGGAHATDQPTSQPTHLHARAHLLRNDFIVNANGCCYCLAVCVCVCNPLVNELIDRVA